MSKIKFLRKSPMKTAGEKALNVGIQAGATVGTAYVCNLEKVKESKVSKWIGPIALALHLGAEIFVEQEQTLAAARGIGSYGALATAGEFVIKEKAKLGLSGVAGCATDKKTEKGTETVGALNWEELAKEAIKEVPEDVKGTTTVDEDPVGSPSSRLRKSGKTLYMDTASKLMAA